MYGGPFCTEKYILYEIKQKNTEVIHTKKAVPAYQ